MNFKFISWDVFLEREELRFPFNEIHHISSYISLRPGLCTRGQENQEIIPRWLGNTKWGIL